jgi:hypothetical protein
MLFFNTPGGFDRIPVEAGEPAKELTLPRAGPLDLEKLATVADKYDSEILEPLPGHYSELG